MKINISFLNPTRVGSLSMRLFFLIFGKCFTVPKALSVPPQDAPQRFRVGDTEAEACSQAHSKSVQKSFSLRSADSWASSG